MGRRASWRPNGPMTRLPRVRTSWQSLGGATPGPESRAPAVVARGRVPGRHKVIPYRIVLWIVLMGWVGLSPLAAHADDLATAREALRKGDLRAASVDLRKAVRA